MFFTIIFSKMLLVPRTLNLPGFSSTCLFTQAVFPDPGRPTMTITLKPTLITIMSMQGEFCFTIFILFHICHELLYIFCSKNYLLKIVTVQKFMSVKKRQMKPLMLTKAAFNDLYNFYFKWYLLCPFLQDVILVLGVPRMDLKFQAKKP